MSVNKLILTGGSGELIRQVEVEREFLFDLPEQDGNFLVVRCWNKTEEDVASFLKQSRELIHPHVPLTNILIVIDASQEHGSTTMDAVRANIDSEGPSIIPITVSGPKGVPCWTRKLNGALKFLRVQGVRNGLFIPTSFDTIPGDLSPLRKLSPTAIPAFTVRQTPNEFVSRGTQEFLAKDMDGMLRAMQQMAHEVLPFLRWKQNYVPDSVYEIGPVACRNTFMLWRLRMLLACGGFDSYTNVIGGQEDTRLFLQILMDDPSAFHLGMPGVTFMDRRHEKQEGPTAIMQHEKHRAKSWREEIATGQILWRLRETGGQIPPEEQDFDLTN